MHRSARASAPSSLAGKPFTRPGGIPWGISNKWSRSVSRKTWLPPQLFFCTFAKQTQFTGWDSPWDSSMIPTWTPNGNPNGSVPPRTPTKMPFRSACGGSVDSPRIPTIDTNQHAKPTRENATPPPGKNKIATKKTLATTATPTMRMTWNKNCALGGDKNETQKQTENAVDLKKLSRETQERRAITNTLKTHTKKHYNQGQETKHTRLKPRKDSKKGNKEKRFFLDTFWRRREEQ